MISSSGFASITFLVVGKISLQEYHNAQYLKCFYLTFLSMTFFFLSQVPIEVITLITKLCMLLVLTWKKSKMSCVMILMTLLPIEINIFLETEVPDNMTPMTIFFIVLVTSHLLRDSVSHIYGRSVVANILSGYRTYDPSC